MSHSKTRGNINAAVTGTNNTGKTFFILRLIEIYPKSKNIIIINPTHEKKYNKIPVIKSWSSGASGVCQIKPVFEFGKNQKSVYIDIFKSIYYNFKNGLIIIDDATDIITPENKDIFENFLGISRRQNNRDIFSIFHSLGSIPTYMYKYITEFYPGYTIENDKFFQKIPPFLADKQKEINEKIKSGKEPLYYRERILI